MRYFKVKKGVAGMAGIAGSKFTGRLSLILRSFGNLQTCHTCHIGHVPATKKIMRNGA